MAKQLTREIWIERLSNPEYCKKFFGFQSSYMSLKKYRLDAEMAFLALKNRMQFVHQLHLSFNFFAISSRIDHALTFIDLIVVDEKNLPTFWSALFRTWDLESKSNDYFYFILGAFLAKEVQYEKKYGSVKYVIDELISSILNDGVSPYPANEKGANIKDLKNEVLKIKERIEPMDLADIISQAKQVYESSMYTFLNKSEIIW